MNFYGMTMYKPLWMEGALLLPQHFQQQALMNEAQVNAAASLGAVHAWGLWSVDWDLAALEIGRAKLQELIMRLPDGTLVDSRKGQSLPPARDLHDIPAEKQAVEIFIGLPLLEQNGSNLDDGEGRHARARRFRVTYDQVPDLLGEAVAEMGVEQLNLSLVFDFESRADLVCCPIGRLMRNAQGGFQLDRTWIPPCLTLNAHESLLSLVERMSDILLARSAQLAARRGERNRNVADYSVSDVSLFWLLNCINAAWPELFHLRSHPDQHPERLWVALARLAGSLATFALDAPLERIPAYRHEQLQRVFGELEAMIRDLLDTVIPSQVVPVALERVRPTLWRAHLNDERLLENADFFLSAHADLPGHRLQEQLPAVCKVGAPEEVERIINSAVIGVPIKALQRVPSAVPLRLENQYFSLDERSQAFARMLQARSCSIYIPASIPEAVIELFAVLRT